MLRMSYEMVKERLSKGMKVVGEWFWKGLTTPPVRWRQNIKAESWKAASWKLETI